MTQLVQLQHSCGVSYFKQTVLPICTVISTNINTASDIVYSALQLPQRGENLAA